MKGRKGFTLIEVLVVVGITAVLSGIVITYTSSGRDRISLQIERAKLAQVISRAKALSVSTYNSPDVPCGYGVRIDKETRKYAIFRYKISPCSDLTRGGVITINGDGYSVLNEFNFSLPKNMEFAGSVDTLFFLPPDPKTLIWKDGLIKDSGEIILKNLSDSYSVTVNSAGQITF